MLKAAWKVRILILWFYVTFYFVENVIFFIKL